MSVAWRHRLVFPMFAFLVLIVCEAQVENESVLEKIVYPRGNHWAVGHLMGKKSIDESLGSDNPDGHGEQSPPKSEELIQPDRFLQTLISVLAGPVSERDTERVRNTNLRQQRALEQRKLLEEELEREREQAAAELLLLALNLSNANTS